MRKFATFIALVSSIILFMGAGLTVRINPASVAISTTQISSYDAEGDIGLIAGDATDAVATANTAKLNSALSAGWAGGSFTFVNKTIGSVLKPIEFSGKTFYFKGTIITSDRIGTVLRGTGASGYIMGSDQFTGAGTFGGVKTRFVRTDGQNGPVIRLHGTACTLENIDFYGRPYSANDGSGTKAVACIQVEGGGVADSHYRGVHTIIGCGVHEATYGIQVLDGYYDASNVYHTDENHADLGFVSYLQSFNCGSVFRSENKQALGWQFEHIGANGGPGSGSPTEVIVFDMVKGGMLSCHGLSCNHPKIVLISVQDNDFASEYEYGTQTFEISGLSWDAYPHPAYNSSNTFFTIFRYAGYFYGNLNFPQKHLVRVSGGFGEFNPAYYDTSKLIDLGGTAEPGLVIGLECYTNILNLPVTNFARSGAGPWYRWQGSYSGWERVVSGAFTVREQYHTLQTEGDAATDDLDTINGGGPGSILVLKAYDTTHTIVVKNGTGNIKLAGSDFSLDNTLDVLVLVFDGTNWDEISRADNGA